MKKKNENIPLLDCPVDYLIGDASGKILNEYGRFPCKIKCCVYAYVVRGSATATINITKHTVTQGDVLVIEPGSFLLIHQFTEDALVYYILFSSAFLEKNTFGTRSALNSFEQRNPVLHVNPEIGDMLTKMVDLLIQASNCEPSMLSSAKMVYVFNILQTTYEEGLVTNKGFIIHPQDRKQELFQIYNHLVLLHYHEWHHVSQYAAEMRITVPHLCSTIKTVSGRTAGDWIIDAIVTDAQSQLKITNLPVKEIALSLGFDNVSLFNRFFKLHTDLTPKQYRNT